MATRDRYGGFGEPAKTQLQRYILNACDPQNFEPNLALNLEIADMINAKKGNAPREAAISIVNYVNHRNANVSLLALNLLDICVKNCGYPFHLQVSTKEFLNELVRRFPERPPVHPSRVQNKILGLIEEWRSTICQTSRYKEDLGFIRDMHRLLSYKGYVFPEVRQEDAAVLNSSDNLRSAEEMEEEEREAQSAKLQELIRRGGPADLQEANRLMKIMAGYDTRNKTDWRAKAAEEVSKVQEKAKILEDMLQRHRAGDTLDEGDVFEELANALMSAHPKIQKMCEEESDDHAAVAKLLEINDSIHRTIERYKLIKKGDVEGAAKIPKGTLGTSGVGVTKGPNNELSLIDLGGPDDEPMAPTTFSTAPKQTSTSIEDDLLGLSLDAGPVSQPISLGPSNGFASPPPSQPLSNSQITSLFQQSTMTPPIQSVSPPAVSLFNPPQPKHTSQPATSQSLADPFASLASGKAQRQSSPFQFQESLGSAFASPPPSLMQKPVQPAAAPVEDEWDFASALPKQTSWDLVLSDGNLKISWKIERRGPSDPIIHIISTITNNTNAAISDCAFQVAVTKAYTLELDAQSSVMLTPNQKYGGITQSMRLKGVPAGQAAAVRMRWKVGYIMNGKRMDENGSLDSLPAEL